MLATAAEAQELPSHADVAIFTAPIAVAGSAILSGLNGTPVMVFAPLGVNFTAADQEWVLDVAFLTVAEENGGVASPPLTHGYTGFWFGFGPTIHTGSVPLNGLFFTPKVTVAGFRVSTGETAFDFLVGADFGYQATFGPVYVGIVFGLGLGLGWADNDSFAGPLINLRGQPAPSDSPSVVIDVNLHVLRIGFAF